VLTAPLMAFVAGIVVFAVVYGAVISLQHRTVYDPAVTWAGVANFLSVLRDGEFWASAWFTLRFAVIVTVIEVILGIGLALLFNRVFPGKRILFLLVVLPITIAPALISVMFRLLTSDNIGAIPLILEKLGLSGSLYGPGSVVPLLVSLDVLHWTPFVFLIIYSGLQSFPGEIREAARVDGASNAQVVLRVVLPLIRPVIVAAAFLRFVDSLRIFDVIYVLTGGGPGTSTQTLSIYIYKHAFIDGNFGIAAAAGVIMLLAMVPFVPMIVNRLGSGNG